MSEPTMKTETTTGHTATPWVVQLGAVWAGPIVDGWRRIQITQPIELDENLKFIVRAVNAHDELVSALVSLTTWCESSLIEYGTLKSKLIAARAAIAKAEASVWSALPPKTAPGGNPERLRAIVAKSVARELRAIASTWHNLGPSFSPRMLDLADQLESSAKEDVCP